MTVRFDGTGQLVVDPNVNVRKPVRKRDSRAGNQIWTAAAVDLAARSVAAADMTSIVAVPVATR